MEERVGERESRGVVSREREREKGERKLLFLGLLGLVEGVYGSLLILC